MNQLLRRLNKESANSRGESVVELVITIAAMMVILPLFIVMISSTLNTREVSNSIMSNTVNTLAVQTSLDNDIESASAIKVTDGSLLSLRSQDGTCKAWKINDGNLVRADSNQVITDSSEWSVVSPYFAQIDSVDVFEKDPSGSINYNFKVGKGETKSELKGSAKQKAASSGSGECW